jgi:hypothetical protein
MGLIGNNPEFARIQAERIVARRERVRKRMIWLIFLVYWLLILEGVLRKWILPEFSNVLFFVRDPFVLIVYYLALRNGMWPRLRGFFLIAVFLGILVALLVVAQLIITHHTTPVLAIYGWRAYFLYIPLAFIIADQFRKEDLVRLMRHTMILSIPIAVLVTVQFFSPPSAWINIQAFSGAIGRIRPAGTFSSANGQWMFVTSVVTFAISAWVSRASERMISRNLLILSTAAAFVCLGVSVSRGMMVHSALVMLSAMVAGTVIRGGASTVRAWVLPLVLLLLGVALLPILLPEGYEAIASRLQLSYKSESQHFETGLLGRALHSFVIVFSYLPVTPPMGFGMGLGGNASRQLEGINLPIKAEDEWSRHIVDIGPVFGLLYIIYRVVFFVALGIRSLGATRHSGQVLPVILFGYIGIVLLHQQITGHGSINGYGWIFVGLLMASINLSKVKVHEGSP